MTTIAETCELKNKSEEELDTLMYDSLNEAMHAGHHLGLTTLEVLARFAEFAACMEADDEE